MEIGEIYKAIREESQKKREENRQNAPEILMQNEISFMTKNNGAHIVIFSLSNPERAQYDFWPGTGKYTNRQTQRSGRGIFNLIKELKK